MTIAGSLLEAWQRSGHHQRGELVTLITKTLQDIPESDAQALPIKDPEPAGVHDRLSSMFEQCGACLCFRGCKTYPQKPGCAASNLSSNV